MKQLYGTALCLIIFISCTSTNQMVSSPCDENTVFKEKFFDNVSIVENYTLQRTKGEAHGVKQADFKKALKNISQFVEVSYEEILNYNFSYSAIEIFEKDKREWVKWYNANKCNNLKWRNKR